MKILFSFLFIGLSILNAQEDTISNKTCIQFNNYCYSSNYRPQDEKVGEICSVKDFMMNGNAEIVSFSAFISWNGVLLPIANKTDEKEFLSSLSRLVDKIGQQKCMIMITIMFKYNNEDVLYPNITLVKCKD